MRISILIVLLSLSVAANAGRNTEKLAQVRSARSYVAELIMTKLESARGRLPAKYAAQNVKQICKKIAEIQKSSEAEVPELAESLKAVTEDTPVENLEPVRTELLAMETRYGKSL